MNPVSQSTAADDDKEPLMELKHRGFSALILIDGVPTPVYRQEFESHNNEFHDPVSSKRITTGWIPSMEGKSFSVAFRNDEGEDAENASCGHIFVDGKDVASAIMRPGRRTPVVRHGAKISPTRIKEFTFGKLKLTDDDSIADPNDPRANDIGTIRVELKFVRLGDVVPLKRCDPEEIGVVHEKAKKAGIHTTTYPKTTKVDKGRAVSTAPLYPDDEYPHHVVFIFRYRSADILMANGIMPRPANPSEVTVTQDETQEEEAIPVEVRKREAPDTESEASDDEFSNKKVKVYHQSSEDDGGLPEPDDTMGAKSS